MVKEHEIECEFRFVHTYFGEERIFKDLMINVTKRAKEINGVWKLGDKRKYGKGFNLACRATIEPDGNIFCVYLDARDSTFVEASATVYAGEHGANKYRAEMRLYSNEGEFTNLHYGPVLSKDIKEPWNHEDAYTIPKKKFAMAINSLEITTRTRMEKLLFP